jgi:hypothetical protein
MISLSMGSCTVSAACLIENRCQVIVVPYIVQITGKPLS